MVWIKLCCHSGTKGAEGLIGDIIDADEAAAAYLCSDGAAVKVDVPSDFKPFVQIPVVETAPVAEVKPAEEKAPEPKPAESVVAVPGENPKKAQR